MEEFKFTGIESIHDFLKTVKVEKKRKIFKSKHLLDFAEFINETEDLDDNNWSFDEVEKLMVGDTFFGRCPISPAPFMNYLSKINDSIADSTYNNVLTTLKQFGQYLADEEILQENPAADLEPKKLEKKDCTIFRLTIAESIALLTAAYNHDEHRARNFALVLLLLSTATRIGEAIKLLQTDFILDKGIIFADGKSLTRTRLSTPGLTTSIKYLLLDPLRAKALENQDKDWLFYSSKGGQLTTKEANEILKKLALEAGITRDISTYWLRRTFANILAESGFSTRTIQIIFDHDKIQTTEGYISDTLLHDLRHLVDNSIIQKHIIDVGRKFTLIRRT